MRRIRKVMVLVGAAALEMPRTGYALGREWKSTLTPAVESVAVEIKVTSAPESGTARTAVPAPSRLTDRNRSGARLGGQLDTRLTSASAV